MSEHMDPGATAAAAATPLPGQNPGSDVAVPAAEELIAPEIEAGDMTGLPEEDAAMDAGLEDGSEEPSRVETKFPDQIKDRLGAMGPYHLSEIDDPGIKETVSRIESEILGGVLSPDELGQVLQDPKQARELQEVADHSRFNIRTLPTPGGVELIPGARAGDKELLEAQRAIILENFEGRGRMTIEPRVEGAPLSESRKSAEPEIRLHEGGGVASVSYTAENPYGARVTEVNMFDHLGKLTEVRYVYEQKDRTPDLNAQLDREARGIGTESTTPEQTTAA